MDKEIFIPSMEELEKMELLGGDIYKYLVSKVVEIIMLEGTKYPNKGYLKGEFKYIRENPSVAHSVCLLRPEEIKYCDTLKYDTDLCLKLLDKKENSKTTLDYMNNFSDSVLDNLLVARETILKLSKYLNSNPEYRFTYVSNKLLDSIFMGTFDYKLYGFDKSLNLDVFYSLCKIEPYYALSMDSSKYTYSERVNTLVKAMNDYTSRYDVNDYFMDPVYTGIVHKQCKGTQNLLKRIKRYQKDNLKR